MGSDEHIGSDGAGMDAGALGRRGGIGHAPGSAGDACCTAPDAMVDVTPLVDGADELAALCKALGHPARVAIVRYLDQVDRCVCGRIVSVLPLAQSTVSQHLKILKESGLVRGEVEGPRTCYCLDRERLAAFRALASSL